MLRKIRVILATAFFALITLLLLNTGEVSLPWLNSLAKIQFLPAVLAMNVIAIVALALLTLIFGRIYCSVICPLGVFQDLVSWTHGRWKKNRFTYRHEKVWLRYPVLLAYVLAIAFGIGSVVVLLAPYGTYGRFLNFYRNPATMAVTIAVFGVICLLAWRAGRTWCNTICPVGTTLSLLARFSWLKIRFDENKCKNCGLCSRNCKASCIDFKHHKVDYSRCVTCGVCIGHCNFDALHYGLGQGKHEQEASKPANGGRRAMLLGTAAVAAEAVMAQTMRKAGSSLAALADKKDPDHKTPITPPGSMSAAHLARHCVGCQLCIAQCPNHVLRPAGDLQHFMQPVMTYGQGACRPECNHCSTVCPTGAIAPISLEDKASTQLGHAVWRKPYCVVLTDHVECGNCARHCPAGAIQMVPSDPADEFSPRIPAVNEARCTGCGMCEYLCPARPNSAIYVEGHETHKLI